MNTFVSLLSGTWVSCLKFKIPILVGAVVFGTVLFLIQGLFVQRADEYSRQMMLRMGMDPAVFEELTGRMEQGDKTAFDEMLLEFGKVGEGLNNMDEEQRTAFFYRQSRIMATSLLPLSVSFLILSFVIILLGNVYFLVLAVDEQMSPLVILKRALRKFLPLLGISIWVFLRSFLWIPIIGIIPAIYFLPRFVFSGVILVGEGKGIRASVQESYERTKGAWLRIVCTYIGLMVVLLIAMFLIAIPLRFTGSLASPIMAVVNQLLIAFATIFTVLFARKVTGFRTGVNQ